MSHHCSSCTSLNNKLKKPNIISFYVFSSWHILWNLWYILRVSRNTLFSFQMQRDTSTDTEFWPHVSVPGYINWKKQFLIWTDLDCWLTFILTLKGNINIIYAHNNEIIMSWNIAWASILYAFLFWDSDYKNYDFFKINQTTPSDVIDVIVAYK